MPSIKPVDATVVGSRRDGLTAAVTCAYAGFAVQAAKDQPTFGGARIAAERQFTHFVLSNNIPGLDARLNHEPSVPTVDQTETVTTVFARFALGFCDIRVATHGMPATRLPRPQRQCASAATAPNAGAHSIFDYCAARMLHKPEFSITAMPTMTS
jgi:hypothetical protein